MLVEVRVKSLGLDRANNNPVVILEEEGGEGSFPYGSDPVKPAPSPCSWRTGASPAPSPTTSWFRSWAASGAALERVIITEVVENTYFAELIIQRNGALISVDARPSDSIAVALRMKAKIFAEEGLLEQATIEIAEEESVNLDPEVRPRA